MELTWGPLKIWTQPGLPELRAMRISLSPHQAEARLLQLDLRTLLQLTTTSLLIISPSRARLLLQNQVHCRCLVSARPLSALSAAAKYEVSAVFDQSVPRR